MRRKLNSLEKEQLLTSLHGLRKKFGIITGGLTVMPDGTAAFVFVDEEKLLPDVWQGIPIVQRETRPAEVPDDGEVLVDLDGLVEMVAQLYKMGDVTVHPDKAFRAGVLLGIHHTVGKKELTAELYLKAVASLDATIENPSES